MGKIKYVVILTLLMASTSCEVLQQAAELTAFARCKFKLNTIENINLAGVDVQKIKNYSQLSFIDIANLTSAFTSGRIPLRFTLNMQVNNPNEKPAAMNKLDWILLIDDIEMNQGEVSQRVEIPSGGNTVLPLKMNIDLNEVLQGKTIKSIINFGLNLADASGKPSRITIKAKPTIIVAGQNITYLDFITINNDF